MIKCFSFAIIDEIHVPLFITVLLLSLGLHVGHTTQTDLALPEPVKDEDYPKATMAHIKLGQLLFYDKELSGNRNIACATCHHPRFGSSDGQSLSLGEGGIHLGPNRIPDPQNIPEQRIARNAPALWNVGALEFTRLFHDGRLEKDEGRKSGVRSPLGNDMALGFNSILSAQAMFPVLSPDEMAGHYDENDISTLVRKGIITPPGGAWDKIAARIEAIPEYRDMFHSSVPETQNRNLHFSDISNAIASFITFEFRSDNSAFDAYLRGKANLSTQAMKGALLFYGKAGCVDCHSGKFQTDHDFHTMGSPQLGPGKGERFERHQRDTGRERVSNDPKDLYAFRTPSLRNVTLTAPYGHAGGHNQLDAFIRHHIDPIKGLKEYKPQAILVPFHPEKPDWAAYNGKKEFKAIADSIQHKLPILSEKEITEIIVFLKALEDPVAKTGRLGIPPSVPSGLALDQ